MSTGKSTQFSSINKYDGCSLAFSPDSKLALSAGSDHEFRLWDVAVGKVIHTFEDPKRGNVPHASFSADGKRIFSWNDDCELDVWDLAGKFLHSFGEPGPMPTIPISPDGKLCASRDPEIDPLGRGQRRSDS